MEEVLGVTSFFYFSQSRSFSLFLRGPQLSVGRMMMDNRMMAGMRSSSNSPGKVSGTQSSANSPGKVPAKSFPPVEVMSEEMTEALNVRVSETVQNVMSKAIEGETYEDHSGAQLFKLELPVERAEFHYERARRLLTVGAGTSLELERVIKEVFKAFAFVPDNPKYFLLLAKVFIAGLDISAAMNCYRYALSIEPDNKRAKVQLAQLLTIKGKEVMIEAVAYPTELSYRKAKVHLHTILPSFCLKPPLLCLLPAQNFPFPHIFVSNHLHYTPHTPGMLRGVPIARSRQPGGPTSQVHMSRAL